MTLWSEVPNTTNSSLPFLIQCFSSHSNFTVRNPQLSTLYIPPLAVGKDGHVFEYWVQETNQETKPCRPLSPYFKVPVTFAVLHFTGLLVRWRKREKRFNMTVQTWNPRLNFPVNMVHLPELFLDASDASFPTAEINFTLPLSSVITSSKLTPQNQRRYEYSLTFSCDDCRWTPCNTSESLYFHSAEILAFWGGSGIFESLRSIKNEVGDEEQIPYNSHRGMSGSDLQLSLCGFTIDTLANAQAFLHRDYFKCLRSGVH